MRILGMGVPELAVILVIVLLIFGPKNLPKLGSALGKSVRSLRDGLGSNSKTVEEADGEDMEVVEEAEVTSVTPKLETAEETPKKRKVVVKKSASTETVEA